MVYKETVSKIKGMWRVKVTKKGWPGTKGLTCQEILNSSKMEEAEGETTVIGGQ